MTLALPALLWAAANPLPALALASASLGWRWRTRLLARVTDRLDGRRVSVTLARVTVTVAVGGE